MKKNYRINKSFLSLSKVFFLFNTLKKAFSFFYDVILFYTVFYLKLKCELKIDPKMCSFKNLHEILKTWKNFQKTFDNPVLIE